MQKLKNGRNYVFGPRKVYSAKSEIPKLNFQGLQFGEDTYEKLKKKLKQRSCVSRFSSGGRAPASVFGLKLVAEREELPCIIENVKRETIRKRIPIYKFDEIGIRERTKERGEGKV